MFRSLTVAILCVLLTSCVTSQPSTGNFEAEVTRASEHFWATRDRGDAAALAAEFTETAKYMVPGLPDADGRSAIRELLQVRLAGLRTTGFKVHRREIDVMGDSAYELGWFSEVNDDGQNVPMEMQGRYLIVWNRERDDSWRVHRYFYNFSGATPR